MLLTCPIFYNSIDQSKYDDILYFYAYNYALIQNEYNKGLKRGKDFRKIHNYIQNKEKGDSHKQQKISEKSE